MRGEGLTELQKRFCSEYIIDCNASQAAIRAGYSKKGVTVQSTRLLANVSIRKEIDRLLKSYNKKRVMSAEDVVAALTDIAKSTKEKTSDRLAALDKLGKHLKIFSDFHNEITNYTIMDNIIIDGEKFEFDVGTPKGK